MRLELETVIETVVDGLADERVTLDWLKEALRCCVSRAAESATVPVKPFNLVRVTANVVGAPWAVERELGLAETVKSGPEIRGVTLTCRSTLWVIVPLVATTITPKQHAGKKLLGMGMVRVRLADVPALRPTLLWLTAALICPYGATVTVPAKPAMLLRVIV